uniref:F-box family-1 n=1 Tax=Oryza minuta TaxID=63629 RepID=E0CW87_ORYMI|nr:F-box family-1 [Oryza minuta]
MPPPWEAGRKGKEAARPSGDRIGHLPDVVLHHILGLLPAPDAVRTCVLARRWRHLWKSATGLRITDDDGVELHDFVDHLLLLRGRAPLDTLSDAKKISSQSLKSLNITLCDFSEFFRTRIDVPNLVSLRLDNYSHRTPVFEGMPLLVDAFVGVTCASGDFSCCPRVNDDLEECPYGDCDYCHSKQRLQASARFFTG